MNNSRWNHFLWNFFSKFFSRVVLLQLLSAFCWAFFAVFALYPTQGRGKFSFRVILWIIPCANNLFWEIFFRKFFLQILLGVLFAACFQYFGHSLQYLPVYPTQGREWFSFRVVLWIISGDAILFWNFFGNFFAHFFNWSSRSIFFVGNSLQYLPQYPT